MRKFAEGGYETAEGENESIKEDTRSRARKFIEDGSPEQDTGEKPVTVTKTKTSVTTSKPKADMDAEKDRMEKRSKEQALETVSPELDFMPAAKLAAGAGALYAGARAIGKRMLANRAEKESARTITTRAGKEIPVKQDTPKVSKPSESDSLRFEADQLKRRGAMNDKASASVRERASKMASGGSVRSSASRRADGCAIRGKTRA